MSLAFVPGFPPGSPRFLGRFLSPLAEGVAAQYVRDLTQPGDLVLDPFAGAGTTILVADRMGRRAIGLELNPTYAAMARRRITSEAPLFSQEERSR